MKQRTTQEEALTIFNEHNDEYKNYEFITFGKAEDGRSAVQLRHKDCGNVFWLKIADLRRGRGCPKCNTKVLTTKEEFQRRIDETLPGYEVISFSGMRKKATLRHISCGEIFQEIAQDAIKGHGCPKCNGTPKKTTNEFQKEVCSIENGEYSISGEYKGNKVPMAFVHSKCGHLFMMRPNDFLNGQRCPFCSKRKHTSTEQSKFCDFIRSVYHGTITENYSLSNKRDNRKELDVYLPDKKIGFEYDGIYWHSTGHGYGPNHHKDKMEIYRKAGIRVVNVFSDEWKQKKDIVKEKIKSIIGVSDSPVAYARKCEVRVITEGVKSKFLNSYHIQGNDKASFMYGLYLNEELVAVMTFCKPRVSLGNKDAKEGTYELSRFATGKYRVVGGFSKLLDYAEKNVPGMKRILTYADLRYTSEDKNVYGACGFSLLHESQPNYYYIVGNKRLHRYNFRKSVLKEKFPDIYSDDKTEFQIMNEAGIPRIYDCGNLVFEKVIDQTSAV